MITKIIQIHDSNKTITVTSTIKERCKRTMVRRKREEYTKQEEEYNWRKINCGIKMTKIRKQ